MAANREPVTATGAPEAIGPYVHAVVASGLLFCSGQIPLDPRTGDGGKIEVRISSAPRHAVRKFVAECATLYRLPRGEIRAATGCSAVW